MFKEIMGTVIKNKACIHFGYYFEKRPGLNVLRTNSFMLI